MAPNTFSFEKRFSKDFSGLQLRTSSFLTCQAYVHDAVRAHGRGSSSILFVMGLEQVVAGNKSRKTFGRKPLLKTDVKVGFAARNSVALGGAACVKCVLSSNTGWLDSGFPLYTVMTFLFVKFLHHKSFL